MNPYKLICCALSCLVPTLIACGGSSAGTNPGQGSLLMQTTTALTTSAANTTPGVAVTLTATVTSQSGTPTGSVSFFSGSTNLGTSNLSGSGVATLTLTNLPVGADSILAIYAASGNFVTSSSPAVIVTVSAFATTTALTASPTSINQGSNVTLTATVTSPNGTPQGAVNFLNGSTPVGQGTLNSSGVATLNTTSLPAGTDSLTASFAASGDFGTSTSSAVTVTVTATAPPPTPTVTAAINTGTTYQTIVGFGGAEAFEENLLVGNPNSQQIYTSLFDPTQGLGVTILRLQDVYQNSNTGTCTDPVSNTTVNNCFDSSAESIASEASHVAGSGNLQILMSSWSPPSTLKSNGSINGGTLAQASGSYVYSNFASYLANSIAAYRAENVSPTWVSLQNEPNFIPTSYASCGFGYQEGVQETDTSGNSFAVAGYPNALDATYAAIQALASPPTIIGPETDGLMGIDAYLSNMNAAHYGVIAHHLYNVSDSSGNYVPNSGNDPPSFGYAMSQLAQAYPHTQIFETEFYNNATTAGSDNYGFDAGWTIHESLTQENAAMYLYWALTWGDTQQGLIYIDSGNGIHYEDQYYAMKHFAHYVRPGYKRVDVQISPSSSSLAASAYISPDGKTLVAVLLNTSLTAQAIVGLNFTGFSPSTSTAYQTVFTLPSGTSNPWNNIGSLDGNTVTLPAESMTTVVMQ